MTDTHSNPPIPIHAAGRAEQTASTDECPGVLRGGVTLMLQTRQAQRLVKGRAYTAEKPAIIGLIGFATLLRSIWHGARADDPYADWWLLKVHDALALAERELIAAEQTIATRLQALGPIQVSQPVSIKPAKVALNFTNPYAFRAARLVGLYDGLVRTVLSARHVGLLEREEAEHTMHVAGRVVRRVLQSAVGYRLMGLTRRDVEEGTLKALQARDSMGELPEDVRTGKRRATYAPAVAIPPETLPTHAMRRQPLPDLT